MVLQRSGCCFIGLTENTADKAERIISLLGGYTVFLCAEEKISFKRIAPYRLRLSDLSYEDKLKVWMRVPLPEECVSLNLCEFV